ncbi:MAG: ABC transporter ATP-binding protein [Clostridium sp.]
MGQVILKNISHSFGNTEVLHNINLKIEDGELFTLLGPSGCGKTTILRILAGFLKPSKGSVILDEKDISKLSPEKRNIGTVFQNYALFPNMNVEENILYGLKVKKMNKIEMEERSKYYLDLVGMYEYRSRRIQDLSGGQQQRVALARSLAIEPKVLLLDEPMSNLDAVLREKMREEIRTLQQKLKITTLFITHDQKEALSISDNIAVLDKGNCIQLGSAKEIYNNPTNEFVANFIGDSNVLSRQECRGFGIEIEKDFMYLRPEIIILEENKGQLNSIMGMVQGVTFNGSTIEYKILVGDHILKVVELNRGSVREEGEMLWVNLMSLT